MKYVITKGQKRLQQNLLIQLWRFMVLSVKFMKLTQTDFSRPIDSEKPSGSEQKTASEQTRDIKLVYTGDSSSSASEKIVEPGNPVKKQARQSKSS